MKRIVLLISIMSSLIAGCMMAPKYEQPQLPVAEKWNNVQAMQNLAAERAHNLSWQEFFKSAKLQKVIKTTLANNRDLMVAALKVEAARALYRIERVETFPSAQAELSESQIKTPKAASTTAVKSKSKTYKANIGASFEVDLFGRVRSQNKAALEDYFATEAARDAVQIALIAEAANAYLEWQFNYKIMKLAKNYLAAQEKSYEIIRERYASGLASKLELAEARTMLEKARANKALYEKQAEQAKNALQLLMGSDNPWILESLGKVEDGPMVVDRLLVGVPSEVLLARPDIKQVEHQLKSANANIGVARAAFFPTITLTGSYGFASSKLDDLFSSGSKDAWGFAPQISLPIFEGGRNLANVKLSKINKEIVVKQYEKAIQTAFREVADQLAIYKSLSAELDSARNLEQASEDAYRLSFKRYEQGVDNYLETLEAERAWVSADQNKLEVEKQVITNLINLYKTMGGGAR